MNLAISPYVSRGIAIVGASVIVAAPITAPPLQAASVQVAASVPAVVQVDVQLAGLLEALLAVPGQTVTNIVETARFYLSLVPGYLEHDGPIGLIDLPINAAIDTFDAAIRPLVFAFIDNLPSPIGGGDSEAQGLIFRGFYAYRSFAYVIEDVNYLVGSVLRGVTPLGDVFSYLAVTAQYFVRDLMAAITGTVPFVFAAAPAAKAVEADVDPVAVEAASVMADVTGGAGASADTAAAQVDSRHALADEPSIASPPATDTDAAAEPTTSTEVAAEPTTSTEATAKPSASTEVVVKKPVATDLSDGNKVEPVSSAAAAAGQGDEAGQVAAEVGPSGHTVST